MMQDDPDAGRKLMEAFNAGFHLGAGIIAVHWMDKNHPDLTGEDAT